MIVEIKKTWAILVAGGSGQRFGAERPKQFLSLAGQPVLEYSLQVFEAIPSIDGIVLVLPEVFLSEWKAKLRSSKKIRVTVGGATRQDSVAAGLAQIPKSVEWVLVHDAARPLVEARLIERCLQVGQEGGAAVLALPVADTLKRADDAGWVTQTLAREGLFQIQTPQVFHKNQLEKALSWAKQQELLVTDEATILEKMGEKVRLVPSSPQNFKITRPEDFQMAEAILKNKNLTSGIAGLRVGQGYDVHALVEGRDFILGGIHVPFEKGLKGHSDADALTHAICDALLGAISAGDLGQHFPDTSEQWKDASSLVLLRHVAALVAKAGFGIANVDATVICQRPKLKNYIPKMKNRLAETLKIAESQVSVKATTEEGMGFTGTGEGVAVSAIALIQQI